ncbi:MAG: DUF2309 domain-containing protein [Flavobacteriia bacterium]|nr:DUF2309 domain-containing protein [Flavobacteriia bacterium]
MEFYKESTYNEINVLKKLQKFLPFQAPLKDFVFQNILLSFQDQEFHEALRKASSIFGYKNYLKLEEFRAFQKNGVISNEVLEKIIVSKYGEEQLVFWLDKILHKEYKGKINSRIGVVRDHWKEHFKIDLDSLVHPILFRIICSYLDQGISIWNFPAGNNGFLSSLRELEKNSLTSFFKNDRAKKLLIEDKCSLSELLEILVGNEKNYEHYLFDQQFAHPGWSGMVAFIEMNPDSLLDKKKITLSELIQFELLLEIDALDSYFTDIWSPLCHKIKLEFEGVFDPVPENEYFEVLSVLQEAYEWTYYDNVLSGLLKSSNIEKITEKSFQVAFCIDDRECSLRRYIEQVDSNSETFGTPGHFNVEFYFQPEHSNFYTKVCPAPITPKFLIKEYEKSTKVKKDFHFSNRANGLVLGWIYTHTLGFWSVFKLFASIFKPSKTASFVTSSKHMDPTSILTIDSVGEVSESGLKIGFTLEEMVLRVSNLFQSIGLTENFASTMYFIGHGSSSANNPFYATMDCGACSCRPGSVNARVISFMANKPEVRAELKKIGIHIPDSTQFIGGLHDTARDQILFYDEGILSKENLIKHNENKLVFLHALQLNSKERSRRFMSINTKDSAERIHKKILTRTVSLFEPRPELDHATASLCIVGKRNLTKNIFLDRRAFLNSYDYSIDPDGKMLLPILNAATPVCGGINLNYYFSKVDNQNLGAGTKLPHNVMGLFGVSNGIDGDLRPGLPIQMVELHDPVRLLMIVEHFPDVVLKVIQENITTYEWYENKWINLIVVHPENKTLFFFDKGRFSPYSPTDMRINSIDNVNTLVESTHLNLPVYLLNNN